MVPDMNSENKCVGFPTPEVQGRTRLVDPPDGQTLEGRDGFWVLDGHAVILVFMEVLDTARRHVQYDGRKVPVGVRT